MKRHIVIGSSSAALGVLNKLRGLEPDSEIICITKEKEFPYNTCLIADYLAGRKEETDIYVKNSEFFTKNNIKLLLEVELKEIYPESNEILISTKEKLSYDTLFLGLGTRLEIPKIQGTDFKGVFGFHTLLDTNKILDFINKNKVEVATIVGAGLSGIECADSLANKGIKVNVIELQDRILPALVDRDGSKIIEKRMLGFNVDFYPNSNITEIIGKSGIICDVKLSDGHILKSDLVIFATGGKPNIKIAQDAGIKIVNNGIAVNEFMQTNISNIYAAGDVASVSDILTNDLVRNSSWPDAMQQGICAAYSMAGSSKPYPGVCTIASSHFYGITFVSCGPVTNPNDETEIIIKKGIDFYHKYLIKNKNLIGFLMVGNVENLGNLRKKIVSKELVDPSLLI